LQTTLLKQNIKNNSNNLNNISNEQKFKISLGETLLKLDKIVLSTNSSSSPKLMNENMLSPPNNKVNIFQNKKENTKDKEKKKIKKDSKNKANQALSSNKVINKKKIKSHLLGAYKYNSFGNNLTFLSNKFIENHKLKKAEKIINDLYNRNIYRFVGEILIPNNQYYVPDINEFLSYDNPKDEFYLTEEDIEIKKTSIDYGYGNKNPFQTIYFYNPKVPEKCYKKLQSHSILTPEVFKEYYIKIICKDKNKMERANKLFDNLKKRLSLIWSPVKEKRKEFNLEYNQDTASKNNFLKLKRERLDFSNENI
jgi:hypothetical protein